MFSFPLISIFVDKKNFKQKLSNNPLIYLQIKLFFLVKKKLVKKINEIIIIPVKKKIEKIIFLIIFQKLN